ncbi:hypothetical protein [Gymnodinialimonas sp. 57CJ19]|uniref:hypothetical protein n=1 Tax=Gymnodinialimonas sp. 57CJ19 TaxID=3138498 RepID=UPI0031344288
MKAAALLLFVLPTAATASGLDCIFTTICSPQTDCQTHPGVPFSFESNLGNLSFSVENQQITGSPLSHLATPAMGALFQTSDTSTVLLTIAANRAAVMTQQDVSATGGVRSVSYFGSCEPVA